MKVSTLIALAASELFKEEPQRLGLRICPITLTASELVDVVKELRRVLGAKVFIVGSAPGVPFERSERTMIAPDHRAAEQATAWRNSVEVKSKEHLIYVSVEDHPKASGLKDCLVPVREDALRDAFLAWCDQKDSGLPAGLAESLKKSGLDRQVRIATLCEFAQAAKAAGARAPAWEAVGNSLPVMGLARDTRLSKADAADRLAANAKIVRAAQTGESRRRTAEGPLSEMEAQVQEALASSTGQARQKALAAIDLKPLTTRQLAPPKATRPKPSPVEPPEPAAPPAKPGKAKAASAPEPPPPPAPKGKGRAESPPVKASPKVEPRASRDADVLEVEEEEDEVEQAEEPSPAPGPAKHARVHAPALPKGLAVLVDELLRDEGHPVEATLRVGARSFLEGLPKIATLSVRRSERALRELPREWAAWAKERKNLLEAIAFVFEGQNAGVLLAGALPKLLEDGNVERAARRFVDATIALYNAAVDADQATMREVLALDTCAIRDSGGVTVRVAGPTHLLTLGLAYMRQRALASLSDSARKRVKRAIEAAPSAPAEFLEVDGAELGYSGTEGGLLVFERTPEVIPQSSLVELGEQLIRRYLSLCPHALLGCRVAIYNDREAAPLIEGLSRGAIAFEAPSLRELSVLCARPPDLSGRSFTASQGLLGEGRLRLGPLPVGAAAAGADAPHIAIHVGRPATSQENEEPASPAHQTFSAPEGPVRTVFELREHRLRVRTSIAGVPELEAFEALHAASRGRAAQRAFIADASGLSLRAELERLQLGNATWGVIVGPSVGRRPPLRSFLLVHERVDEHATCAVVTRDVRPAIRAVQQGLRKVELHEERPKALQSLATRLASATRAGLVSLRRTNEQLVAAGLLAIEIGRRAGGSTPPVIAPIEGQSYEALVGEPHDDSQGMVWLGVTKKDDGLSFVLGYTTLDPNVDVDLSKAQIGGELGRRIGHLVGALQHALSGDGPAAEVAREALSWVIWPALAGEEQAGTELPKLLLEWRGAQGAAIEVVCLLPPAQVTRGKTVKSGKVQVAVQVLDVDLINRVLLSG
ncbi:hypothetical protein [Polyangium fumosum]|uniref:Uncharacterized protein n=1 Tax=Polyangium fumosum TaxID=889272 RepID=A0A4U1IQJ1_9BACT|nr:hypothetical protein [Polyangium fumosum]TKC96487.1 hypothetical protein E8A74_45360 [Polyangium fumosum]